MARNLGWSEDVHLVVARNQKEPRGRGMRQDLPFEGPLWPGAGSGISICVALLPQDSCLPSHPPTQPPGVCPKASDTLITKNSRERLSGSRW